MTRDEKIQELVAKYEADEKINELPEGDEKAAKKLAIAKRAKQAARLAERSEALKVVVDFVKSVAYDQADIMDAVKKLEKAERVAKAKEDKAARLRAPRGQKDEAIDLFTSVGQVIKSAVFFEKFDYGRGDMLNAIKTALKKAVPAERKWIGQAFQQPKLLEALGITDYSDSDYVLYGVGELPPEGWTGYVPTDVATAKAADIIAPGDVKNA